MKISYPFAAVPNQVCRGGHGAVNLAVLTVLLSHGRSTASLDTLAAEVGSKRETVKKSIEYWRVNGQRYGIVLIISGGNRRPYTIEIDIERCEQQTIGVVITKNNRRRILKQLFEAQGGKCFYCHVPIWYREADNKEYVSMEKSKTNAVIEHRIPLSRGGLDTTSNVVASCDECNTLKRTKTDIEFLEAYPHLGGSVSPKEGEALTPKRGTDEEHLKKNQEEDNLAPAAQEVVPVVRKDADIIAVFEVFQRSVNPAINYANRTYREAAAALIKAYGVEKVIRAAEYAVANVGRDMFPQVTNPHELREKFTRLASAFNRGSNAVVKIS